MSAVSQTVEAREFVLKDERAQVRARLKLEGTVPRLVFYDRWGKPRLWIGLEDDGSPSIQVEGRQILLGEK